MPNYGKVEYWNERYAREIEKEITFDWLGSYSVFRTVFFQEVMRAQHEGATYPLQSLQELNKEKKAEEECPLSKAEIEALTGIKQGETQTDELDSPSSPNKRGNSQMEGSMKKSDRQNSQGTDTLQNPFKPPGMSVKDDSSSDGSSDSSETGTQLLSSVGMIDKKEKKSKRKRANRAYDSDGNEIKDNGYPEPEVVDILDPYDLEKKIAECKILVVGCGNSSMVEEMYDVDGFRDVHSVDISANIIKYMYEKNIEKRPELTWHAMDVRDLQYPDETFDAVIDKATIDSLLCGEGAYKNAAMMLKECQRVMKTGGYYFCASQGKPENREYHFKREHLLWTMRTFAISTNSYALDFPHHVFVMKKEKGADQKARDMWQHVLLKIAGEEIEDSFQDELASRTKSQGQNLSRMEMGTVQAGTTKANERSNSQQVDRQSVNSTLKKDGSNLSIVTEAAQPHFEQTARDKKFLGK